MFEAIEEVTEVDCDLNLNGIKINKISVSPIGVSLIGTGNKKDNADKINVSVKMTNGSVTTLKSAILQNEDAKVVIKYMPLEPIKVVNVKEVSINGNIVELK